MGKENPEYAEINVLVIGCTPLARKVVSLVESISNLVGVVNLHPEIGLGKSNYDYLADFTSRRKQDVHWTKDINSDETISWMKDRNPDVIIQCGWSQIFNSDVLSVPNKYCIGIHPSPLPVGRGAAIINWKIIEAEEETISWGNSLFVMEAKTDTGDVLDFEPFDIETRDDVRTAYLKVDNTALKMIARTLSKIADGACVPQPQDPNKATRYFKRKPKDGIINRDWALDKILNYVRALTHPYPGAFLETKYGKITIWSATQGVPGFGTKPGTIVKIFKGKGVHMTVGDGWSIMLGSISTPDGLECWSDVWASEVGLKEGDML